MVVVQPKFRVVFVELLRAFNIGDLEPTPYSPTLTELFFAQNAWKIAIFFLTSLKILGADVDRIILWSTRQCLTSQKKS